MSAPEITAVIVSWNSAESLRTSLAALHRSADAGGARIEIVVIDNASADDSTGVAAEAGADLVVRNPSMPAMCRGVAGDRARPRLLDHVGQPRPNRVRGVRWDDGRRHAERRRRRRLSRARHPLRGQSVDRQQSAGSRSTRSASRRKATPDGRLTPLRARRRCSARVPADASSAATRSRQSAGSSLYFAYMEDVDLGWRLRKHGYRAFVVPGAVALHEGSASTGEGSWLSAFLVARETEGPCSACTDLRDFRPVCSGP